MVETAAQHERSITSVEMRIGDCPRCGYPLRGLPPAGRCPECGLAYDEASCIFRHAIASSGDRSQYVFHGLITAYFLMFWLVDFNGLWTFRSFFFVLLMAALLTWPFVVKLIRKRSGSFEVWVACLEEGLLVRLGVGMPARFYRWDEIEGVRVSGRYLTRSAAVRLRDRSNRFHAHREITIAEVFADLRELERFVELVNRHLDNGSSN